MARLSGKRAVITGAGSGIGKAGAVAFAAEGAQVVILDVNLDNARKAAAECVGGPVYALACDVTSEESVASAMAEAAALMGGIDVCWANAGGGAEGTATELTKAAWDWAIAVNLTGGWLTAKYALPHMIAAGAGSLIFTASTAGYRGSANVPAMAAAKAGLMGLTRQIAMEYAPQKIRANAVLPGATLTPTLVSKFHERAEHYGKTGEELLEWASSITPLGRLGKPEDQANAALFLASDESAFITGEWLAVDGGLFVKYG